MFYCLNFTGHRDLLLSKTMEAMFRQHSVLRVQMFKRIWCEDYGVWGNGAGWEASLHKVQILRRFEIEENDFLVCIDSDVLFFTSEVTKFVNESDGEFLGIQNVITVNTLQGDLNHMGGCLTFIKGNILKKINTFTDEQLFHVRNEFKAVDLCENEDVVISYLAQRVGAKFVELPTYLWSGGIEQDLRNRCPKSFYHVNYAPTEFLGEPCDNKWNIPKVLTKLGYI
jgi:hypothetical protein